MGSDSSAVTPGGQAEASGEPWLAGGRAPSVAAGLDGLVGSGPLPRAGLAALCLVAALVASCGPASRGSFAANGYSSTYGYYVPYHGKSKELMPPGWQRDAEERVTSYAFDDNGDGIADEKFKAMTYALRFEQPQQRATIWMRDIPLSLSLRGKTLRVLSQRYIAKIAGANYEAVRIDEKDQRAPATPATIVEEGPMLVAGRPAYFARLDVPDAEAAGPRRLELIFFRAPKEEVPQGGDATRSYPVLVVAGYANLAAAFDAELPTFRALMSKMIIEGKQGLTVVEVSSGAGTTPAPQTSAPAVAPVAPKPAPVAPKPAPVAPKTSPPPSAGKPPSEPPAPVSKPPSEPPAADTQAVAPAPR